MAQCELRGLLGWLVVGRSAACVDSGGSVLSDIQTALLQRYKPLNVSL